MRSKSALALLLLLLLPGSAAWAGSFVLVPSGNGYVFTDLGTMDPHDVNSAGTVVGAMAFNGERLRFAAQWTEAGGFESLGSFGSDPASRARAISENGVVVGESYSRAYSVGRAAVWRDGEVYDLGLGRESRVRGLDVNDSGLIAGIVGAGLTRPFVGTESAGFEVLGTDQSSGAGAYALNDRGDVVGSSGGDTAFLWTEADGMIDLGALPGDRFSRALGVNDSGSIVGFSARSFASTAVIWTASLGIEELNLPDGTRTSQASDINDAGDIVGYFDPLNTSVLERTRRAFILRDGIFHDLNDLVYDRDVAIRISEVRAISDAGHIVGIYTAVPEPSSAALVVLGLVALARRR